MITNTHQGVAAGENGTAAPGTGAGGVGGGEATVNGGIAGARIIIGSVETGRTVNLPDRPFKLTEYVPDLP